MISDEGKRVVVTGGGGFIGHHLIRHLVRRGYYVRGVDIKSPEFEPTAAHEFEILDLRRWDSCLQAMRGMQHVYALAADMGGIGFIETNKAQIVRDSTLFNMHSIEAARIHGVERFLFTSSACIYPGYLINELVDMVAKIASKTIFKIHDLTKPQDVRGRNSENSRLRQVLGWEPRASLEEGLTRTYRWIEEHLSQNGRLSRVSFSLGATA